MTDPIIVFNREVLHLHRVRALPTFADHDFLFREVCERLLDRLEDVNRQFPLALDLGARGNLIKDLINDKGGVETLIQCTSVLNGSEQQTVSADDELPPFAESTFDLIMSNLCLHWINDLPGTLSQIRRSLKPDGMMIASMFGGDTLKELRSVLNDAELNIEGGLSPRISPFADIRDVGGLMQRAGFALPVTSMETITVSYSDPIKLLKDLRGMGETNAVKERRLHFTRKETLIRAMQLYRDQYADSDGRIPVTFQILFLSGWAPAPTQQQAMKPGSAKVSLTKVFNSK